MSKQSSILKAMGNPYRFEIINQLLAGEMNVTSLNKKVKVSQPALSQHLSVLKREGILSCRREQRTIHYRIVSPKVGLIKTIVDEMAATA